MLTRGPWVRNNLPGLSHHTPRVLKIPSTPSNPLPLFLSLTNVPPIPPILTLVFFLFLPPHPALPLPLRKYHSQYHPKALPLLPVLYVLVNLNQVELLLITNSAHMFLLPSASSHGARLLALVTKQM